MKREKKLNVRLVLAASEVDRYEAIKARGKSHDDIYLRGLESFEKEGHNETNRHS